MDKKYNWTLREILIVAVLGAVFAVLLALAPWHIFWSQLGRYYSLKFLLIA